MLNRSLLIIFFFGLGFNATAQEPEREKNPVESLSGRFVVQVGIPSEKMQDAIRNEMGNLGFGGSLALLSNPFSWGRNKRNSPFRLGGELGYNYYGRFLSNVNIGGYSGNYKTSYGILHLNAIAQLRPQYNEFFTPFLEVFAGGNCYLSSTKENLSVIESALGIPAFEIDSYASVGFNKGLAAGFSVGRPDAAARFFMRVSYNVGTDIKYVVRNSLQYDPGYNQLTYQVGRAPVKYLIVQAGISFY
ncbi:MAG: hypothetical protein NVV59_02550 [Chitinophagaceae bacterium]|nr:hypothetical protein [Chitinophagaceae bacterium]